MLILIFFSDDWNSVAHVFPFEMENGTEPFGTGEFNYELFIFNKYCINTFFKKYFSKVTFSI